MRPPHASTNEAVNLVIGGRLRWCAVLALLMVAFVAHHARRDFIRSFFVDGRAGAPPTLPAAEAKGEGVAVERLRVVLIDGLGLERARMLPHLNRHCRAGLDLRLDVGFPTVSLPVQHVLWTGLTQAQSGVMYRIAPLSEAPRGSLPERVPHSVAIAESHPEIVHSFGFGSARPDRDTFEADEAHWRARGFARAAVEAVTGPARLVFIHVLRVDEAGHAQGAASAAYEEAASWADERLEELVRADADASTRWVVLSDHGHRSGGGHGGSDESIRIVRACVFGEVPPSVTTTGTLHLVDLHRLLADSLELEPLPEARGRPLAEALVDPRPGATLPRPSPLRWVVATAWLLAGVAATAWAARGDRRRLPWWLAVAYVGVAVIEGHPTLSHPMVYPPLGKAMLVAASPGMLVLAWSDWRARAESPSRRVVGHLALVTSLGLAALTLCGALERWLGVTSGPPLMPSWTAQSSLLLVVLALSATTVALLIAIGPWLDRRAG